MYQVLYNPNDKAIAILEHVKRQNKILFFFFKICIAIDVIRQCIYQKIL